MCILWGCLLKRKTDWKFRQEFPAFVNSDLAEVKMKNVKTRVIATLSALMIFLAAILTGWQGTIQFSSPAFGFTLDSRAPIAINQAQ
jgi:hypothetical protein